MAKNGVFKKITALAMAITLVVCFAVSASAAVSVNTQTTYDGDDIKVNVTVTATDNEITEGTNVTYYAKNALGNVHFDQVKATGSSATFEFNVDGSAQLNSDVAIGYTGASKAEESKIKGFTVTLDGAQSQVIPTEAKQVSFTYTATASNKEFKEVTADVDVPGLQSNINGTTINVTFTKISSDVNFTLVEQTKVVSSTANASAIGSGGVLSTGANDKVLVGGEEDAKGNVINGTLEDDATETTGTRKITVMGKVTDLGEDGVYGVIITTDDITEGAMSAADFEAKYANYSYAGLTKASTGLFAVQVIDDSDEAAGFIRTGVEYKTAVYAKDASGNYTVDAGDNVTIPAAEATN